MAQTQQPGDGEEEREPFTGQGPQADPDDALTRETPLPTGAEETTAARAAGQPGGEPYGGPATPGRGTAAALGTLGDGRYRLTHRLGRGGMAEVLAAQDIRLGRTVAVKLLRAELAQDDIARQRFTREAHSVASLNHHSIVAVYDTGEEMVGAESTPYIVMELVEGRTVRELLVGEQEPPVDQALIIIAGVLEALDYSHRHGIVHRDIKPANVIITTAGAVKVMDFGIARALAGGATTMTQTGMVMGTPQYLSPEQALGKPVDHRSDLYAAGCMLYELLTLRPPFVGDTPLAVVYQHVQDPPVPPSRVHNRVPWQLDDLVLRSLAKNPDERFQSADEFRAHVQHALREMHAAGSNYPTTVLGTGTPPGGIAATAATTILGGVGDRTAVLPHGSGGYQTPAAPYQGGGGPHGGGGGYGGGDGDGYDGGYDDGYHEPQPRGRRKALAWGLGALLLAAAGIGIAVAANGGGSTGGTPAAPGASSSAPQSPTDEPTSSSPSPVITPSPSRASHAPSYTPTDGGQQTYQTSRPGRSSSPSASASGSPSASGSGSPSASGGASPSGETTDSPTSGHSTAPPPSPSTKPSGLPTLG
ncbi:protein kinase domain-containing protein [Kitasatospora viridis]|uniref:non-specific serine/threonine protein kinase n=1 Tax=Kitasatospora viridis TaxID=281105 RepID=A0A561UHM3_9ACTN|nr:protein kinase [Kitasatospora viridis]TWF98857.1 serine/threonine-protein kinase [Kitasatospora viridis]